MTDKNETTNEIPISMEEGARLSKELIAVGGGGWAMGGVGSRGTMATGYARAYGERPMLICRETLTMVAAGARVDTVQWYRVGRNA